MSSFVFPPYNTGGMGGANGAEMPLTDDCFFSAAIILTCWGIKALNQEEGSSTTLFQVTI